MDNPGPGSYKNQHENAKKQTPKWELSRKLHKRQPDYIPGPGQYNPKTQKN